MKILLVLVVSIAMMVAVTANASLIGEWLFNEGSGDAAKDTSGNNNHGAINKATWVKTGKYGSALDFDGANGTVAVEHKDVLSPKDAATVTVWTYLRRYPAAGQCCLSILSKGGVHKDFDLQVETDKFIKWYVSSTPTNYNVVSKTQMPLNEWTFIAVTYKSADGISIYVNGKLENTTKMAEARDASTEPIRIGFSFWSNRLWDGMLDELRLFDSALSEAEIGKMMESPSLVNSTGKLTITWGKMKSE